MDNNRRDAFTGRTEVNVTENPSWLPDNPDMEKVNAEEAREKALKEEEVRKENVEKARKEADVEAKRVEKERKAAEKKAEQEARLNR